MELDEMGDLRGRIHVGKQDLQSLKGNKGRKMKGLRGDEKDMEWNEGD
jgi:ribosome production factor 2